MGRDEGDPKTSNFMHAQCHECNGIRVLEKGVCTQCGTVITPQAPHNMHANAPSVSSIVHNPNMPTSKSMTPTQVEGFAETIANDNNNNNKHTNSLSIACDDDSNDSDAYDDDADLQQLMDGDADNDIDMDDEGDITSNLCSLSSRSTPPPRIISFKISPKHKSNKRQKKQMRNKKKRKANFNFAHN